jgi:2-dehydro-3-deoxygluconokinase
VDVMLGNEKDFSAALGLEGSGFDEPDSNIDAETFARMIRNATQVFPFKVVAATLRKARTATRNRWGARCYSEGAFYEATTREDLDIYDRVGGGDSFAAGLIYGFLAEKGAQWAVECGAAHGALAMTTPGDTSMATLKEVLQVMRGGDARIAR